MVVITSLVADGLDVTLGARGYQRPTVVDSAVIFPSCGEAPAILCVLEPGDDYFLNVDDLEGCSGILAEMNANSGCTADPMTAWTGGEISVTSPGNPSPCRLFWTGTAWNSVPL